MVSDSERQAVQLSLLTLLASVFFSGFVLPLDEFTAPVRVLAYLLPVTHGIQLLQDLMLRGTTNYLWEDRRAHRDRGGHLVHRVGRPAAVDDARPDGGP